MGLDMYLKKKTMFFRKEDGTMSQDFKDLTSDKFGRTNSVYYISIVGYWRKVNCVHRWFVDNVQYGTDDCNEYYVSIDQLKKLYDKCWYVIKVVDGMTFSIPKEMLKKCNDVPKSITIDSKKLEDIFFSDVHTTSKNNIEKFKYILPTMRGCFFGSYEFNLGYIYDIAQTILMLDDVFADYENNKNNCEYTYQASW